MHVTVSSGCTLRLCQAGGEFPRSEKLSFLLSLCFPLPVLHACRCGIFMRWQGKCVEYSEGCLLGKKEVSFGFK